MHPALVGLSTNELRSRVTNARSDAEVGWSAIPLGTLVGGLAITWSGNVALIYAVIGVIIVIIPLLFALTPLGHAERYMPGAEAPTAD